MEAIGKIKEKSPDDYIAAQDAFKGTYDSARTCVYVFDYKYSMIPEDAKSKSEEENFVFFDICYFEPGAEAELSRLFDEMKKCKVKIYIRFKIEIIHYMKRN